MLLPEPVDTVYVSYGRDRRPSLCRAARDRRLVARYLGERSCKISRQEERVLPDTGRPMLARATFLALIEVLRIRALPLRLDAQEREALAGIDRQQALA